MTNRVYLLITVLLVVFTFSLPEAATIGTSTREPIGAPSWSVTIPAKNAPSIGQRMALKAATDWVVTMPPKGKISENESPLPQDRVNLPKKDTTQTPGTVHINADGLGQALKNKK